MRLNEKAMLVKLSIGLPGNSRNDKKLTGQVKASNHLGASSGKWLKQMFPDEHYEPASKLAGEVRTWHYAHTLPWLDDGVRILTTAAYFEYCENMRKFKAEFEAKQQGFIASWEDIVVWARREHNGTFNESDYANKDAICRKFQFETSFRPMPEANDFRVQLNDDEVSMIKASLQDSVSCAVNAARSDLWQRLASPLKAMADKLKEPDAIFRNSLVENLHSICELIPALNLTEDTTLDDFRKDVQAALTGLSADTLRDNKTARKEVADKAAEILAKMSGYMA